MELPLAASSGCPGFFVRVSNPVAGSTLTSALVSTRNCCLEMQSVRKRRPPLWPVAAATNDWPCRFPTRYMVVCISMLLRQRYDGRNRAGRNLGVWF